MEPNPEKPEKSVKEQRIRNITSLYYSNPEVQKAIFEFSKNREICPRYFEGFGKRPDNFQYQGDIFELVKKGATSFHCSEELWSDALKLSTNMKEKELNELRIGWDLLIDIDSKYIDYSKIAAQLIIKILKFHGIKNLGIKFSGSKGFHIIIPWKSFPPVINEIKTSDMFPEWPRILVQYLNEQIKKQLIEKISELERPNRYIKDFSVSEQVMPDLILVSPRHLFRMPYSLHEKTALASIVLSPEEIENFQLIDASPLKIKIRNFMPDAKEDEARELLLQALDWYQEKFSGGEKKNTNSEFKPLNIKISDDIFPPSIKKILLGIQDGKKRALFVLINFFRSIGMEKEELEKRIYEWNKKNEEPLREGYLQTQLIWSYRNKIVPPPNYDKDYYKGIGIIPTDEEMRYKNPVSYMAKKYSNDSRKS
jgi:DNA primase catalytic subunit